jgi:hypothetical protein
LEKLAHYLKNFLSRTDVKAPGGSQELFFAQIELAL